MRLEGARVWITGASSGIGEAVAAQLLCRGASVALTARSEEGLERVARAYQGPSRVMVAPADVTDKESLRAVAQRIEREWGGVDLAMFNAGIYTPVSGASLDTGQFEATFRVNLFGVLYGLEAVLPSMLQRGTGRVAATSSLAALIPVPRAAAYGGSKAALTYALESLRLDLRPRGIGVTIIHPGFVRTQLTQHNDFTMPGLMEAAPAAATIVRAFEQDRDEVAFPAPFATAVKLAQRLPFSVYRRLLRLSKVSL